MTKLIDRILENRRANLSDTVEQILAVSSQIESKIVEEFSKEYYRDSITVSLNTPEYAFLICAHTKSINNDKGRALCVMIEQKFGLKAEARTSVISDGGIKRHYHHIEVSLPFNSLSYVISENVQPE